MKYNKYRFYKDGRFVDEIDYENAEIRIRKGKGTVLITEYLSGEGSNAIELIKTCWCRVNKIDDNRKIIYLTEDIRKSDFELY